nr:hypothetical protein [Agathobaculum ammoniilyticum]
MRTAVNVVWDPHPALLETLAQHPLPQKPKASKFLSILALHLSFGTSSVAKRPAGIEMPVIQ